jgi:succinate dehydrogenase / fumarate reductase iron-sulfur subunit
MSSLNLTLHVWRQKDRKTKGQFVTYKVAGVSTHASFLEMLDILNEQLIAKGEEPVAFDHDCREGICGMCSLMINGRAHGGRKATTTCQLHMRTFKDGDEIWIEPWRASAFPVIKDLCVDRQAMDDVQKAGGFITVNTGSARDANDILVPKESADRAMDAAACIQCGACVAACTTSPRASPSACTARSRWSPRWTPPASATARTTTSARRPVRRTSRAT